MATTAETVLLTIACVIVLGFLGSLFFRYTRISDILILIGFGLAIDGLLRPFDTSAFIALAPIVGAFALLIILFEGGLDLLLVDLLRGLSRGTLLATSGFVLTVGLIALVYVFALDGDWLRGLLLGCILGGSSSIAVMPLVKRLRVHQHTRVILSLESALTDVFCVVGALTISDILILQSRPDIPGVGRTIMAGFAVALLAGVVVGTAWLKILDTRITAGLSYMLTLAVVLLLYTAVIAAEGNGPVAVLIFGVVLGNHRSLRKFLRIGREGLSESLRGFQTEVAFVTRAFFFVYLGVVLDPSAFTLENLGVGVMLVAAIALARLAAVFLSSFGAKRTKPDMAVWWAMMPRGLAAAVLASVPSLTFGIADTDVFVSWAAMVIILTNIVSMFAGLLSAKEPRPDDVGPVESTARMRRAEP